MDSCMDITYEAGTDRLDVPLIVQFLRKSSYWARERSEPVIRKSLEHSLCFGAYAGERQIGFGRAVTDRATFFYLADIFVLPDWRGQGFGKALVSFILSHEDLKNCRGLLTTQDAHALYERFGFTRNHPIVTERTMALEKNRP